jgi:hypothetical protein
MYSKRKEKKPDKNGLTRAAEARSQESEKRKHCSPLFSRAKRIKTLIK